MVSLLLFFLKLLLTLANHEGELQLGLVSKQGTWGGVQSSPGSLFASPRLAVHFNLF